MATWKTKLSELVNFKNSMPENKLFVIELLLSANGQIWNFYVMDLATLFLISQSFLYYHWKMEKLLDKFENFWKLFFSYFTNLAWSRIEEER